MKSRHSFVSDYPRIVHLAICIINLALLAIPSVAWAQDNTCFSSFVVKDKPVVLNSLPGGTPTQIMKCSAAEEWRQTFYIANRPYLDSVANGTSAFYVSEIERTIAKSEEAVKDLEKKISENENLSALSIIAKVALYEASKVKVILKCTQKPKSFSCAEGVIKIAAATYDVMSGSIAKSRYSEIAANLKKDLASDKSDLSKLKTNLAAIEMKQVKADMEETFFGMCQAIKRDCLK